MAISIPLAFGRKARVSPEDEARIRQYAWFERRARGGNYYAYAYVDGRLISMHRFLLGLPKGIGTVDHIDRDGLNNTRENIRVVTPQQNASRRIDVRKSNGFRGASRHHRGRQWVAQITAHGKRRYLGCFNTEIEASAAYFAAARDVFGEFAPTPPPPVAALLASESYRLAGFTFHASAPQLVDDRALVGRGVGVGAASNEPHPITHSMDGHDYTADADDVDDNC